MNRSFLYGIIFASSTWCFSLYLYWLLVQQQQEETNSALTTISRAQLLIDGNIVDERQIARGKISPNRINNRLIDHGDIIESDKAHVHDKSFISEKLQKWKKEQKFKKISQKLIDELKPVADNSSGRKS